MESYYENDKGKLYNCNCLDLMKEMEPDSVDCIATDPPYGYSFMGKNWDRAVPSVEIWHEALRILKDGAFAFIMSAPRQDVLMHNYLNLQQAGFDTAFTSIYWCYASGFPKALNIAGAIDKKKCRDELTARLGRLPTMSEFKEAWDNYREVIGVDRVRGNTPSFLGSTDPSNPNYDKSTFGVGTTYITAPSSPEAKEMDGSYAGFQPKPALEVIIVAMKPLSEKTYVEQALKNGKGVTWLDNCRIPFVSDDIPKGGFGGMEIGIGKPTEHQEYLGSQGANQKGRFPANLLVSDNALGVESNGAIAPVKSGQKGFGGEIYGKYKTGGDDGATFYTNQEESKSFSRYFDVDRWFDERVKELPESIRKTYPFLIVPKPSKAEKNLGCEEIEPQNNMRVNAPRENEEAKHQTKHGNNHPTVKSIALMSYLITLGSRKGDLICDPFVGSGTTIIASELLERRWVASELDIKSCEISRARLSAVPQYAELPTLAEVKKMRTRLTQKNLFDYT